MLKTVFKCDYSENCFFIKAISVTLRSTNQFFLHVPWFSTEFGKTLFSYLAPTVWNGLSSDFHPLLPT